MNYAVFGEHAGGNNFTSGLFATNGALGVSNTYWRYGSKIASKSSARSWPISHGLSDFSNG